MQYSFKKGFTKGIGSFIVYGLGIASSFVLFAGFSDIDLWTLLETHLKPILSGLTVGGLITMLVNYFKTINK